jgi:hypothetical protein
MGKPTTPTADQQLQTAITRAVASQSRPYTDPKATYPIAQRARDAQTRGAVQRGRS